jgi:hypothetical protein
MLANVTETEERTAVKESVYFYTMHKCASTLFGRFVLKNVRGLEHVNYASQLYRGGDADDISFSERGFVYGPIRVSANPSRPTYKQLIEPMCRPEFVRDKRATFLVRDPRDIIVSSYYSFGYTHGFSPLEQTATRQHERRQTISDKPIDTYAVESLPHILRTFEVMHALVQACERGVLLKYEDMVADWDSFASGLTQHFDLSRAVLREIYERSRPRQKEDQTSHRRSGKTGGFREKLAPATVETINAALAPVLKRFEYEM